MIESEQYDQAIIDKPLLGNQQLWSSYIKNTDIYNDVIHIEFLLLVDISFIMYIFYFLNFNIILYVIMKWSD